MDNDQQATTYGFYRWIWSGLYENRPYDQFVREILTAAGNAEDNPPVNWYREVDQTNEQVEDVAQLFLGLRIQCARCHHHPFEKWSQDDYYGLSAFFSRVGRKNIIGGNNQMRDKRIFRRAAWLNQIYTLHVLDHQARSGGKPPAREIWALDDPYAAVSA